MTTYGTWTEQWERVDRWRDRLRPIDEGVWQHGSDAARDFIYSFFQNCYQLKDWLKSDPSVASKTSDVEVAIGDSPEMRACADLANGTKHLHLTGGGRRNASLAKQGVTISFDKGGSRNFWTVTTDDGSEYDSYDLADRCLMWWRTYLGNRGLA